MIRSRQDCGADPLWQPTVEAYQAAGTDNHLRSWWIETSSRSGHTSFANELGRQFGDHRTSFECGIGDTATCTLSGCSDYRSGGDAAWSYQALISTVNLNTLFNNINDGISNGQQDFTNLIDGLSLRFFPWNEPEFAFGDASFWIVALLSMLFAAIPVIGPSIGVGLGAFAGAGIQQAAYSLAPDPDGGIQTVLSMNQYASDFATTTRSQLDVWANTTFQGGMDMNNKNILDYLAGGSFVETTGLPSTSEIEAFYKKQMISRTINSQWRTRKVFTTFFKTNDSADSSGPNETKWYSPEDGGVYYTYMYDEDGTLKGHLDKPYGFDYLNGSDYDILGSEITQASARAFRYGGFNYTREMAVEQAQASLSSGGSLTPFRDGAAWSGTWNLPVCELPPSHNWNTPFGNKTSRYGILPCCCGSNCEDTKAFVNATNMLGFQTLLRGCKAQLKGTDLDFSSIDYGFKLKKSCKLGWAVSPVWKKAMAVILMPIFLPMVCMA